MDYLFGTVLALQPAPIQDFLLKTAVLERISAPLAAAIVGDAGPGPDSRTCLNRIVDSDLFVTLLDSRQEWHRYHRLFRDFLRKRLASVFSPAEISRLHERAAVWFAAEGLIDEALYYAMAAGNLDLAARLLEDNLGDLLNRGDPATLQRWLQLFPDEYVQRRPGLLMARAWELHFSWLLGPLAAILDQIERQLNDERSEQPAAAEKSILRGQVLELRSQDAYFRGQFQRAIALSEEALRLLPESWAFVRGGTVLFHSMGLWSQSGDESIVRRLLTAYEELDDKTDQYALRHLLPLCFVTAQAGKLQQLSEAAQTLVAQANRADAILARHWGYYFLGVANYLRNDLPEAQKHFAAVAQHYAIAPMAAQQDSFAGLVLVHQAQGDAAGAATALQQLSALDLQRLGHEEVRTRSLRARLNLLQGNMKEAGWWADGFTEPVPDLPMVWLETPHLTRARILLARNQGADVAQALELLDMLNSIAERTHNVQHRIEILVLRALGLELTGQAEGAVLALRRAFDLAHPGGFVRPFVEPGTAIKTMLQKLAAHGALTAQTLRAILAAFPKPQLGSTYAGLRPGTVAVSARSQADLVEPLTPRELEILVLLDQRLSNKEIALRLYITPMTAKRHVSNILAKLGVSRRVEATEQARALGILPER
jgi:LuxR family transcriptional regulator, maltose regulon positive regulatory protein